MSKDDIHVSGRIQTLQPTPKGLGARGTVTFSSQMAAHATDHGYGFAQRRWGFRRDRCFGNITAKCFPFDIFEKDGTGRIGNFAAQHGQMIDAPGDNHVNTQTSLKPIDRSKLAVFNSTAAFERTMIHFNAPLGRGTG